MTWQRIDDDTYIDDTLVTRAEYQLFIDEMREQGKYYQPDHWTFYQFPQGKARAPVTGVRYLDATAFCEWLTNRDNGEWEYQLPKSVEILEVPILHSNLPSLGYWVIEENVDAQFSWIGENPSNARHHNLELARSRFINLLEFEEGFDRAKNRPLEIDYYQIYDVDQILSHFRSDTLDRNLANGRKLDLRRAHSIAKALDHTVDKNRALHLFIDIFTLQERIAGRSPAFEGIRLVKERIK